MNSASRLQRRNAPGTGALRQLKKTASEFGLNCFIAALVVGSAVHGIAAEAASVESFPLSVTGNSPSGFSLLPPLSTGINFSNFVSGQTRSLYTLIPTGVAAGDVDGDGLYDLYFCSSDGTNVLYRNLGNWRFEDITAERALSGIGVPNAPPGAA